MIRIKKMAMRGCAFVLAVCISLFAAIQMFSMPVAATFTSTAAEEAITAFQLNCYNPDTGLYWNNTDHNGIAAIWTHAIYWNMVLDAYERTGEEKYSALSDCIYEGGYVQYSEYNWDNHDVWFVFDDLMWWIISMVRAYELTGNTDCLQTATTGFWNVYYRAYDAENGGMYWGFGPDGMGRGHKNSCINYPTIIAAMELYNTSGDQRYLTIAEDLYSWAHMNLFDSTTGSVPDLLADTGETDWTNYTYNEGTMIGAACMLYQATNQVSYLTDANLAAQYTKNVMCDSDGILPAEGDWNEQGCMKAIFAHYIGMLINDCGQTQWLEWIRHNADTAWANRDTTRNLTYRNYNVHCSEGMIQSYEACSGVALLQVVAPDEMESKGVVTTPSAHIYYDMNYVGTNVTLRPGRYNAEVLSAMGFSGNQLTSLKVPEGCVLQLFSEDNFGGDMWEYSSDCANVGDLANDEMCSCILYYEHGATFYSNDMFQGNAVTLAKGTYSTSELASYGIVDNDISSLAIPDGWSVVIYDGDNTSGTSWTYNRGTHNVGDSCNDRLSSVAIF